MAAKKTATRGKGGAKKPAAAKGGGRSRARKTPADKIDRFVEAKSVPGLTDREAARLAGLGSNSKAAAQAAYRLLSREDVRERIERRKAELLEHARVTNEEITGALGEQLRGFDWIDIYPDDPFVQSLHAAGCSSSSFVKKLKFGEFSGRVVEAEMNVAAMEAAKTLGKFAGMDRPEDGDPDAARRDAENRAWAEKELEDLMRDENLSREDATALIRRQAPTLSQWIM